MEKMAGLYLVLFVLLLLLGIGAIVSYRHERREARSDPMDTGSTRLSPKDFAQFLDWLEEPPRAIPGFTRLFESTSQIPDPERNTMSHPIHLIKRYYTNVEEGKYSAIRDAARAQALEAVTAQHMGDGLDADEAIDHLLDRVGHLAGSRARIIDKLNLVREIVASGINSPKGTTLSDDDYLLVLAGWAAEMRGRFHG